MEDSARAPVTESKYCFERSELRVISYPKAVRYHKKITWGMLDKLQDAGLIVWSDFSHDSSKRHHIAKCKVLLTPAGEFVAGGRS